MLEKEWETKKSLEKATKAESEAKKRKMEESMELVNEENVDGRKNWKRSRFGRAVTITRMKKPGTGKIKVYDHSRNKLAISKLRGEPNESQSVSSLSWPVVLGEVDDENNDDESESGECSISAPRVVEEESNDDGKSESGHSSVSSASRPAVETKDKSNDDQSESGDSSATRLAVEKKEESNDIGKSESEETALSTLSRPLAEGDENGDKSESGKSFTEKNVDINMDGSSKDTAFNDPNVSQGVNLRSLVLGFDTESKDKLAKPASFSILGPVAKSSVESCADLFLTGKSTVSDDKVEVPDEKQVMQNLASSSLFFLHMDSTDTRIRNRTIWHGIHPRSFQRKKTLEDIKSDWMENRSNLTVEWKAKRKSALRKLQKSRRG